MAEYYIKYNDLLSQADSLQSIGTSLASYEKRLNTIVNEIDGRDSGMAALKTQTRTISSNISSAQGYIVSAGNVASNAATAYLAAEKGNYNSLQDEKASWSTNLFTTAFSNLTSPMADLGITNYTPNGAKHVNSSSFLTSLIPGLGLVEYTSFGVRSDNSCSMLNYTEGAFKADEMKVSWETKKIEKYGVVKPEGAKLPNISSSKSAMDVSGEPVAADEAPSYATKKATLFETGIEHNVEGSLATGKLSGKNSWGEGSLEAKVGNAEAHSSLTAGLYVFDKNGNKTLAPSLNASLGASMSALTVDAAGRVGDKNFGLYGKGNASVGKGSLEAGANMSIFNDEGDLDIQVRAKAGAEALALEAKGSTGGTVFGVDVGVSGSLKVGAGISADIGIVDGVIKAEVGAALGIGASVGFEFDATGAVKAVQSGAEAAWKYLTGG